MEKYKRNKAGVVHVRLEYELLNSAAWTALDSLAHDLYIELKKKFDFNKGGYEHLVLPPSEVSWLMSRNTYWDRIKKLIKYGFIKAVKPGGLPKPTVYALSERWRRVSVEIVDKEGREAIRAGYAKKKRHKDVSANATDYWNKKKKKKRRKSNAGING